MRRSVAAIQIVTISLIVFGGESKQFGLVPHIEVTIVTKLHVFRAGSERPKFRDDYRFETAFNAFYKVHYVPETWPKARIRCEAEGTELMVPENLDEADTVPVLILDVLEKSEGVFMGMHDLYAERVFVTLNGEFSP